jgi:SAM-dependent methyltransferase
VPFHQGYRVEPDEDRAHNVQYYARIGDYFFIDDILQGGIRSGIPADMLAAAESQLVYLRDFASFLAVKNHEVYTALTAYALSQVDVAGKHVVDLGCADGIQSLLALKRGAAYVTAIDHSGDHLETFADHMQANGISSDQVNLVCADLSQPDVHKYIAPDAAVVIANIGPHKVYEVGGEILDLTAMMVLQHLPHVEAYIAGGYQNGVPTLAPTFAVRGLACFGFGNPRYVTANEENPRVAFVMERPVNE